MSIRKNHPETRKPRIVEDIERPHRVVADGFGDDVSGEPLSVRLTDVWSDFLRLAGGVDSSNATGKTSAVPILDDMKGILQWD
jgi:hypothetical protein